MRSTQKRARPVVTGSEAARSEAENLLGEFSALLRQIGAPVSHSAPARPQAGAAPDPRVFLETYLEAILLPLELPAIAQACGHVARGELRELIAQDQSFGAALRHTPFAEPSRQVGRRHLGQMRPLRDDRVVQRYLQAVESGRAHGWHTLVYGMTLAVYSLPLRQGLLFYAQQTLGALATAAVGKARDAETNFALRRVLENLAERLPAAVTVSLAAAGATETGLA